MSVFSVRRCVVFSSLLAGALPLLQSGAWAQTPAPAGDLWETTSQISMEGMPMQMPQQTVKNCTPHDWTKPPNHSNRSGECVTSDFKKDGNKTTWTTVCKGHHAMTGKGEIIRNGNDDYTGTIHFTSAQGNMLVKMTGHRIGTCDNPE